MRLAIPTATVLLLVAGNARAQGTDPAATPMTAQDMPSAGAPRTDETAKRKIWHVGANVETHHLIRQSDLQGYASNKHVNYYSAYAQIDPTKWDYIRLSAGVYQRFLVDPGETGFRSSDIGLTYKRTVSLPWQLDVYGAARISAPTSFASEKESLITAPSARLGVTRKFGTLTTSIEGYGVYYVTRYHEMQGGAANPKWYAGFGPEIEYGMPFHKPLSVGASAMLNWSDSQEVEQSANVDPNASRTGVVGDRTFVTQPVQQSYGGEVYVRYTFPQIVGIDGDFTVAYAQGDSTLGSSSWMHDGVGHFYLFWRESSQVYAALTARY